MVIPIDTSTCAEWLTCALSSTGNFVSGSYLQFEAPNQGQHDRVWTFYGIGGHTSVSHFKPCDSLPNRRKLVGQGQLTRPVPGDDREL